MNGQQRVKVGILGLDEMLGGGLLSGSICAIIGTYGTGKTTFSLEFVWDGLKRGEKVIYISLEERENRLIGYMKMKGWDVEPYLNKSLYIIKLDTKEGPFTRKKTNSTPIFRFNGITLWSIKP